MRRLADLVLSTLFAPPCAVCGAVLVRPLEGAVCDACWRTIRRIVPPVCDACGAALPSRRAAAAPGPLCGRCLVASSAIARARALGEYEGALKDILHALKYERRRSTASRLASMMRAAGADVLGDADALVPVPLHPRRRRARGFNQARVLAEAIGQPVWNVLARTRHTTPQVELTADARRSNMAGAFEMKAARSVAGAVLVLVDDVTTTGATLEACAQVLVAAGARQVRALTAARVSSEPRS